MSVFAQGRVMAGVFAVVFLMLAFATFIFSCAQEGVTGKIASFFTGIPAPSICVGWIPEVVGSTLTGVWTALAAICVLAVALG
jgi:hypothetical protein